MRPGRPPPSGTPRYTARPSGRPTRQGAPRIGGRRPGRLSPSATPRCTARPSARPCWHGARRRGRKPPARLRKLAGATARPPRVRRRSDGDAAGSGRPMMTPKTMRIGTVRTSIKLEPEFWGYLKEVARARGLRLTALVNEVADATPDRASLASALRVFALLHARWAARGAAPGKAEDERVPVETVAPC